MGYVENLLAANERIQVRRRQHWYGLIRPVVGEVLWLVFWIAVVWLLFSPEAWRPWLRALPRDFTVEVRPVLDAWAAFAPSWLMLVLIALLLLATGWGLARRALLWWNNEDIVTTRRIIRVQGVLSKTSIDSSLEKINDVVLNQPWIGRLLGFGHLMILTASETGSNRLYYLPDPLSFKRAMLDAKQAMTGETAPAASPAAPAGKKSLSERLAQLDELQRKGLVTPEEHQARRKQLLDEM
jgi:hypothetical protein